MKSLSCWQSIREHLIFPRRLSAFSSALEYSLLDWWRGCNVRSQSDGTADDLKTIQSNTQQEQMT